MFVDPSRKFDTFLFLFWFFQQMFRQTDRETTDSNIVKLTVLVLICHFLILFCIDYFMPRTFTIYFNSCGCSASMCMQLGQPSFSNGGRGSTTSSYYYYRKCHFDISVDHIGTRIMSTGCVIPSPDKLVWA